LKSALFGTALADYWFPVAQAGDIAFIYGVLKILIANEGINREFVEQHTQDWESLRQQAESLDWLELERQAGLPRASFEEFAALLRDAKNAVFVWSMGITQHHFGGDAVQMVLNLALARGYIGREKNGVMPIRGHSLCKAARRWARMRRRCPATKR
jgi:anaerobic selenocysteine-containing dehydrogenase